MSKKSSFTVKKADLIGQAIAWFLGIIVVLGIVQSVWPHGRIHLLISAVILAVIVILDKYYVGESE